MSLMETTELLGNIGEFVGAIAVVATLIYLAVQVRLNSEQLKGNVDAMQISGYQNLMNRIAELNRMSIEDAEFSKIQLLATTNPEELTEVEVSRYYSYLIYVTRHADMAFMQYEKGMLSDQQYQSALGPVWGSLRINLFFRRHVKRLIDSETSPFSHAFKEEMERLLKITEADYAENRHRIFSDAFPEDLLAFQQERASISSE